MIDTFLTRISVGISAFFADPFASETPALKTSRDTHPDRVAADSDQNERNPRVDDYAPFSWAIHGHW